MSTTVVQQKIKQQPLKDLPKGFVNQFIQDQLKSINVKFIKRILPNTDGKVDIQDSNKMVDYIITCKDKYENTQVLDVVNTMMGTRFNRYISNTLGDPKEFNRFISIFEYTNEENSNMIKIHIRGDI